jgi:hypothetical protein
VVLLRYPVSNATYPYKMYKWKAGKRWKFALQRNSLPCCLNPWGEAFFGTRILFIGWRGLWNRTLCRAARNTNIALLDNVGKYLLVRVPVGWMLYLVIWLLGSRGRKCCLEKTFARRLVVDLQKSLLVSHWLLACGRRSMSHTVDIEILGGARCQEDNAEE